MKKFLLSVSFLALAVCANADYSQYFTVKYEGNEIANNATVEINPTEVNDGYAEYMPHINIINKSEELQKIYIAMEYTGTPSYEMSEADSDKWGFASLCYEGDFYTPGNCLPNPGDGILVGVTDATILPPAGNDKFFAMPDLSSCPEATISKYKFTAIALNEDGDEIDDTVFSINLVYGPQGAGVGGVNVDENAPAVYYNLQGVKVDNPENGIYIVRKGGKVSKTVISGK